MVWGVTSYDAVRQHIREGEMLAKLLIGAIALSLPNLPVDEFIFTANQILRGKYTVNPSDWGHLNHQARPIEFAQNAGFNNLALAADAITQRA